jgi:hypothetical protein
MKAICSSETSVTTQMDNSDTFTAVRNLNLIQNIYVLMAVGMSIMVFCIVMPCLHLQG